MIESIMKLSDGLYIGHIDSSFHRSGFGSMGYFDGSYYDGGWLNDKRHVFGKMLYVSGNMYLGGYFNGARHGKGKLLYSKAKGYIEGTWENDRLEGYVESNIRGKGFFKGHYVAGKKEGNGISQKGDLSYSGNYRAGKKHGVFTFWKEESQKKLLVMFEKGVKIKVKVIKQPNHARMFGLEQEVKKQGRERSEDHSSLAISKIPSFSLIDEEPQSQFSSSYLTSSQGNIALSLQSQLSKNFNEKNRFGRNRTNFADLEDLPGRKTEIRNHSILQDSVKTNDFGSAISFG